jgi:hypothetical protein
MPLTLNGTTGIVTANLADASVTTPKIADSAVVTADIANGAVTAAKLSGGQTGSAPVYGCRAWVNFDGTRDASGAASTANTNRFIRASGNVASVLRNTVGDYTINFATPMTDSNYCAVVSRDRTDFNLSVRPITYTSTSLRVGTGVATTQAAEDSITVNVAIFGN